jgi:hypothetical protein
VLLLGWLQATCVLTTGPACASFGAETSYSEPTACCNRLLEEFQQLGFNKQVGGRGWGGGGQAGNRQPGATAPC